MSSVYLKVEKRLLTVTTNSNFTVCRARYQTKLNRVHCVLVDTEKKLRLKKKQNYIYTSQMYIQK